MKIFEKVILIGLVIFVVFLSGCATVKVDRHAIDNDANFKDKRLYFEDLGNLDKLPDPDNADGFLNMLWTNDESKKQAIQDEYQLLKTRVKSNGIYVAGDSTQSDITGILIIKSVRFDPIGGWITDGASIELIDPKSAIKLVTITSSDAFITPSLSSTFTRLGDGILKLWGLEIVKE